MRPLIITATVAGTVAILVGLSAWAIVHNVDALVADIGSTLAYKKTNADDALPGSLVLIEDHGPVPDGVVALRMAICTVLFAGIPAAMFGGWLARRTRVRGTQWPDAWSAVFLGGFVLQLTALLAAPFMFIAFATYVGDVRVMFEHWDGIAIIVWFLLIALSSAASLRSWLNLRAAVRSDSGLIVPR